MGFMILGSVNDNIIAFIIVEYQQRNNLLFTKPTKELAKNLQNPWTDIIIN